MIKYKGKFKKLFFFFCFLYVFFVLIRREDRERYKCGVQIEMLGTDIEEGNYNSYC